MTDLDAVIERLTVAHPDLSPQVRKAGAYVLDHPGDVATLSMRQVAAVADVPPPTMARLAQAVGFGTYNELRDVYRRSVRQGVSAYPERAHRLQKDRESGALAPLWSNFRQAHLENIERLFDGIDYGRVERATDDLLAAKKVFVAGMQASFSFANYMHYVCHMALPNWVLVRNRNGVLADNVIDLGCDDALIVISLHAYARDAVRLARLADERGAFVVALTDSRTSPLAPIAKHLFILPSHSPQFFESYVSATAMVEALIGVTIAKCGSEAIDNIKAIEESRKALGEYWDG